MDDNRNVPVLYTNSIELTLSQYDLLLNLNLQSGQGKTPLAKVVLSWQHAKKFHAMLAQQIDYYEKIYSEIIVEPRQEALAELEKEGRIKVIENPEGM